MKNRTHWLNGLYSSLIITDIDNPCVIFCPPAPSDQWLLLLRLLMQPRSRHTECVLVEWDILTLGSPAMARRPPPANQRTELGGIWPIRGHWEPSLCQQQPRMAPMLAAMSAEHGLRWKSTQSVKLMTIIIKMTENYIFRYSWVFYMLICIVFYFLPFLQKETYVFFSAKMLVLVNFARMTWHKRDLVFCQTSGLREVIWG